MIPPKMTRPPQSPVSTSNLTNGRPFGVGHMRIILKNSLAPLGKNLNRLTKTQADFACNSTITWSVIGQGPKNQSYKKDRL